MAVNYQTRRATIDDLVALRRLWWQAGWPVPVFEKSLTDFQVVETADGKILGAAGLQVDAQDGRIYGEVCVNPDLEPEVRLRLWQRVQTLARQHRLTRLWVQGSAEAFWREQGFEPAGAEALQRLPAAFPRGDWLVLKFMEQPASRVQVELELELLRHMQKERGERIVRRAQVLRLFAALVAGLVLLLIGWAGWVILDRLQAGR